MAVDISDAIAYNKGAEGKPCCIPAQPNESLSDMCYRRTRGR